ncbi:cytoskeleton-associated protein 2-like isoform X2 [Carcharodon carcharias]|uniref:cytoskeleton-associated protein 2-like isoform X2 n=1 Tax=Carcharodon carcharias TaxID=13397 RepID=UPI001B7DE243|nr:cytoskeleton-associated protein 2-like isoform X2 [Carcharodon carcharias]
MAASWWSSCARIEESECRRQQLEAYLARKGKLKVPGPNARYYLGDKTNRKIQPPTAPFKAGLGGALKDGGSTKPSKLKGINNLTSTNDGKSVAARPRTQPNTKTSETKKTLSKTVPTFPQTGITANKIAPTLFPVESNTIENEPTAAQTAHSEQYEEGLNPAASTCAKNLHKSDDQEKKSKRTVDMAPNVGHSADADLIKPFTEQAIKSQVGTSKDIASDNRLWAIDIDRTAKAAPGAAKFAKATLGPAEPVGTGKAAHGAAKPVGTGKVAHGAAKPVGSAKATHGTAKPVGTVKATHGLTKPVGPAKLAHGAAKPVGTGKAAHGAAKPVGSAKLAHGAAKPVGPAKAAHGTAKPEGTAKATHGPTKPVGPAKLAHGAAKPVGPAKLAHGAAKPVGPAKLAHGAAKPVGPAKAAHGAAKPVGTAKLAHGAAKPVGTAKAAHGTAKPVGTAKLAHGAAKPVGTAKLAHGAAKPVGTAKLAHGAAKPVGTAKLAHGTAKPVGTGKVAHGPAKPEGMAMVPKQSTNAEMDKNDGYKRLSKSEQQLASDKTKPGTGLPQNATNSTGNRPMIIWQPFTRSAERMHPALRCVPRSIKQSNGAIQSVNKLTAPALGITKCRPDENTVSKTVKGQDERRKCLEEWLASKGKTYKRPPMPIPWKRSVQSVKKNLEFSFWEAIEEEEEQKTLTNRVNRMLDDCMRLLEKGSPPEQVSAALQNVPEGEKFAKYWICRARLLEFSGSLEAVIALFERAVHSGAEPVEELRSALVQTIMRNANSQAASAEEENETEDYETEDFGELATVTPHMTATRILYEKTDGHGSSVVKYRVTATPQVLRGKETVDRLWSVGKQDVKFLTPVRRSVRIEHVSASYPEMLKEHDCCVTSLNELLAVEEAETFVYRENRALLGE